MAGCADQVRHNGEALAQLFDRMGSRVEGDWVGGGVVVYCCCDLGRVFVEGIGGHRAIERVGQDLGSRAGGDGGDGEAVLTVLAVFGFDALEEGEGFSVRASCQILLVGGVDAQTLGWSYSKAGGSCCQ